MSASFIHLLKVLLLPLVLMRRFCVLPMPLQKLQRGRDLLLRDSVRKRADRSCSLQAGLSDTARRAGYTGSDREPAGSLVENSQERLCSVYP